MRTKQGDILLRHVRKLREAQEIEQLSDRELLRCFVQDHDEPAFAMLVRRHGPMVLHSCQRVLHNWHDAEDVFQATFLILARKAGSQRWNKSVGTWLYLVAFRLALKVKAGRQRQSFSPTAVAAPPAEDPHAVASQRELEGLLDQELHHLPEKYRAPLVLCSLEGVPRARAAQQLGWSLGTLCRRLEQARGLLRQRFVRRGLPLSALLALVGSQEPVQGALPFTLAQSAVRTAMGNGLGQVTSAALLGPRAVALADGALRVMAFSRLKAGVTLLLALAVTAVGSGIAWRGLRATNAPAGQQPEALAAVQPKADHEAEPQPPAVPADESRPGQLVLTGMVRRPDGSAAAGALVSALSDPDGSPTRARTDRQGRFRLVGDFGCACRLHVQSADAMLQTTLHIPEGLARRRSAIPLELRLMPARAHELTVLAENAPVEGVQVAAIGANYKVHGVTGKDGKVTLRLPSADLLEAVVAWHPQHGAAGFRDLNHGIRTAATKLTLMPTAPHTIRVLDTDGHPVPNLRLGVHVLTQASDSILAGDLGAAQVRTDADGNAAFRWLPRQFKAVNVHLLDKDQDEWTIDDIDRTKSLDGLTTVRLRRKFAVRGQVMMPPGASAEGLLITGRGFGPTHKGDLPTARVQHDGSFTLPIASDYGYVLDILDGEWASEPWTGLILAHDKAEPARITFQAYPAIPLTVRVTRGPEHQPVANAWIDLGRETTFSFRHANGEKLNAMAGGSMWLRTDGQGLATAALGKGTYRVRLSVGDWQEEQVLKVSTQASITALFDKPWLDKRRVTARLVRAQDGYKPSRSIIVRAWETEEDNERPRAVRVLDSSEPVVASDGRFEIALDARHIAVLAIDPEQRLCGFARLGEKDSVLALALEPMASYSGVLVDQQKQPLAGAILRLLAANSDKVADESPPTDAQGRFRFDHVPTNVALQLAIGGKANGRRHLFPYGKRLFVPGEKRENAQVMVRSDDGPSADPTAPPALRQRLKSLTRDAHLQGMRVLIVLQGDASKMVTDTVHQLLDAEEQGTVLRYLPLVVSGEMLSSEAASMTQLGWPRPQKGELLLLALDGTGATLNSDRVPVTEVRIAVERAREFLKQQAPPVRDARVLLKEAQREAQQSGRRVWLVFGGPRCGPCFRLARWLEEQQSLLAKDYVVLKLMEGVDQGAWQLRQEFKERKYGGVPWMVITEPDGKALISSEGPLGNIGLPTEVEDLRHVREMLRRSARHLTVEEQERIVQSLSQREP